MLGGYWCFFQHHRNSVQKVNGSKLVEIVKSPLQEQFGALLSFITPIGDFLRKGLKRTFFETLYASCYELKHRPTCVILMVGGVGIISLYNLHAAVFIKSNFRSGALPHLIRVQTNSILIFPLDTIGI